MLILDTNADGTDGRKVIWLAGKACDSSFLTPSEAIISLLTSCEITDHSCLKT